MFFAKILSLIVSFFSVAYVVRGLGPANYGQLSFSVSFVSIFSFIATLGIDQVLYRDLIKYPEKKDVYLGTSFMLKMLAGFISVLICLFTAYFAQYEFITFLLIAITSLTFIFVPLQIIGIEFQSEVRSKYPSIISLFVVITLNILKILTIAFGKGIIYMAFISLFEPILIGTIYIVFRKMYYRKPLVWKYDDGIAKQLLRDSWPMMFASAFALIYARIDQVFIKHLIDVSSVGIYDAAVRITEAWYFIPNIIVISLLPAIINAKKVSETQYSNRLGNLTILLVTLSILVAIPVSLFSPFIMNLLYGASFVTGSTVLSIYIWSGIGTSLSNLVTNYLIAENQRRIIFISTLVSMISNVILNIIFIPKYGIVGSAWATFFSYMITPISMIFFKTTRARLVHIVKSYL